jgi:hypothetical protein
VMLSVLLAVPKTPLYNRLKAAGRLLNAAPNTSGVARYVGTAGGTNFHPLGMTREELKRGQERLYQRLYAPQAFADRLLGNLSRFHHVRFRPESPGPGRLAILGRLIRHYWSKGPTARLFFGKCLWTCLWHSRRLISQMVTYMGMYMHFCKVHGEALSWDPWRPQPRQESAPVAHPAETEHRAVV